MPLSKEQRLTRGSADPGSASMSPQDYFVLSRVEGKPTVGEVLATSGLPRAEVEKILERLLEAGVLVLTHQAPAPPPRRKTTEKLTAATTATLRDRVRERKRRLLQAQFGAAMAPSDPEKDEGDDVAGDEDEGDFEAIERPMVGADDPRIDAALPMDVEDQRWILALADGQDVISPYEFLGLVPTHDQRSIKRAYHVTSRELHPDSYYGKELGLFQEILAALFKRARFYYAELRKESTRAPYVDRHIEDQARRRQLAEEAAAAKEEREQAVLEVKRRQEEAEAAVRRQQRAKERADRQRERLRHNMSVESARYAADADIALKQGNVAKAANLYRLALRADPNNAELQEKWESCRAAARRSRATDAFARAQRYLDMGQSTEAAKLFLEAAEAAPTAEHLAYATEAVCIFDASRARDLAMAALDALASEKAGGANFKPKRLGTFHLMIARGFKAAGLTESAKQQAAIASELRPGDVEVRALLKALKVK